MTKMDWERATQRDRMRGVRGERVRSEASERRLMERQRNEKMYRRFVREHRPHNAFCKKLAGQGFPITKKQAGVLRKIAHENNWPIKPVRTAA